jgi:hypothetical protein
MPIFGVTASSNMSTKLTDFFQIATTTATGSTADVTFSSIAQDYTHLQLRMIIKNHTANTNQTRIQFNSDTASNYSWHSVGATNETTSGGSGVTQAHIHIGNHPSSSVTSTFGVFIVDILDYKNTNKYKTTRTIRGTSLNNTDSNIEIRSGSWRNTAAISTIRIFPGADTFGQYSSFALYGVKA